METCLLLYEVITMLVLMKLKLSMGVCVDE